MADGDHEGQCTHRAPGGELEAITDPQRRLDIDPDKRTVVLKIHGFVDRASPEGDSYVITEDHYIDYLTRTELHNFIPIKVVERLRNCHLLFLGYSLSDWNLRAILARLQAEARGKWDWWAIQHRPSELDQRSWGKRGVEIFDQPLDDYVRQLKEHLEEKLAG